MCTDHPVHLLSLCGRLPSSFCLARHQDDDRNILYIAYSTGQTGAMQIEFDIRTDKVQAKAKETVEEEELSAEDVDKIVETLSVCLFH